MSAILGGGFNAISVVTDYMLLSGYAPVTAQNIDKHEITCIVDATNIPRNEPRQQGKRTVDYVKVAVDDSEWARLESFFDAVADKIEEHRLNGGKTLVHCAAGISRSTSLCCAYLVR